MQKVQIQQGVILSLKSVWLPSTTHFRRLGSFYRVNLVLARILTGRRHQIRSSHSYVVRQISWCSRHLRSEGRQIIGDRSYGRSGINNHFRCFFPD